MVWEGSDDFGRGQANEKCTALEERQVAYGLGSQQQILHLEDIVKEKAHPPLF
jgi:hypothetical protein